jgi:hypothetical protein
MKIKSHRVEETEEEGRADLKSNPKVITNKATKGKYKFMLKYYHRGAFYTHEEDQLLSRDISGATLEDKFDKTVLPKVMQVKNFGRSGRTKYTHLVDQVQFVSGIFLTPSNPSNCRTRPSSTQPGPRSLQLTRSSWLLTLGG